MKAGLLNQSSFLYLFRLLAFWVIYSRARSITTLWEKYKSNFPGKGTDPIQKLFGKFERLNDAIFWNQNRFSIL